MLNVEFDTDNRVMDDEDQDTRIKTIYVGMEDGYVPFTEDRDQFGYDYESVVDCLA